jgi:hypothetical protein
MKPQAVLGLVLVLAGVVLIVLQLSGVFVDRAGLEIGDLEIGVQAERSLPWLPWVAGGGILAGALLMITGRK